LICRTHTRIALLIQSGKYLITKFIELTAKSTGTVGDAVAAATASPPATESADPMVAESLRGLKHENEFGSRGDALFGFTES
jgi:hypothetical protein